MAKSRITQSKTVAMSAFTPKSGHCRQQLWQLGDVHRDPPRGRQLSCGDLCYERQIFTCSASVQTIERLVDSNVNITSDLRAASLHFEPRVLLQLSLFSGLCSSHYGFGDNPVCATAIRRASFVTTRPSSCQQSDTQTPSGIGLVLWVCVPIGYGHAQSSGVQTLRKRLSRSGSADNAARG